MNALDEIAVGKHGIGYVSSAFKERLGSQTFEPYTADLKLEMNHQVLPRWMKDTEILSELNPGICTLADVVAFLDDPLEGSKDGNFNLFYVGDFVVSVSWYALDSEWGVRAWRRGDSGWDDGNRVFSPATISGSLTTESSETLTLDSAIELVKKAGYKIFKEI